MKKKMSLPISPWIKPSNVLNLCRQGVLQHEKTTIYLFRDW